tara:strand:+ start:410 stop:874 length:465 start_codon:yes stop_codon:yes gene_type:complete
MKKVFKWGCMFFIVTFGISLALMLFNLPSEEEWKKTLAEATEQVKAENEKNDNKITKFINNDEWIGATESQVNGCFLNGDDLIKFTSNTMQFNDGIAMQLKRSSSGGDYFINAFIAGREVVAAQIDYNPGTNQFRWKRFESGIVRSGLTKTDCP